MCVRVCTAAVAAVVLGYINSGESSYREVVVFFYGSADDDRNRTLSNRQQDNKG